MKAPFLFPSVGFPILAFRARFGLFFFAAPILAWAQVGPPVKASTSPEQAVALAREAAIAKDWKRVEQILETGLAGNALVPGFMSLYSRAMLAQGKRQEALQKLVQAHGRASPKTAEEIARRVSLLSTVYLTSDRSQSGEEVLSHFEEKNWSDALKRLEELVPQEPGNAGLLLRRGQALILKGAPDEAIPHLESAKNLNPFEPETRLWLGRALFLRGKVSSATEELRRAHRGLRNSENASIWLAEALAGSGQKAAALQLLEQNLKYHPNHLAVLAQLVRYRVQFHEKDREMLWTARREVQLGMSRLDLYGGEAAGATEEEWGIVLQDREALKSQFSSLLAKIEPRLEKEGAR